jgi:uncharacterized RDD family membrane protein YckC
MSSTAAALGGELQAPGLRRRLACLLYEGLLLFGVGLVSGALGTLALKLTGTRSMAARDLVLQLVGIAVYGVYFVWFWTRRGQTLPMQTWRIKLVTAHGGPLTITRAILRYITCALWIAPAYLVAKLNQWPVATMFAALGVGIVVYALLALLHPQRQFWHDALCGTRLVRVPAGRPAAAP